MGSISASIELYDKISAPLQSMVNSMNMVIGQMYTMQNAMNADIDTSSLDSARESIVQVSQALNALGENAQTVNVGDVEVPNIEPIQVPVEVEDIQTPNIQPIEVPVNVGDVEVPNIEPIQVPVEWETPNTIDIFTNTGVERFTSEVQSANQMANNLVNTQNKIAHSAANAHVFSPSALSDMANIGTRINNIQQQIRQIQAHPLDFGDRANGQLEQLRGQLNEAIEAQNELNQAVEDMDVSAANDAYRRLQSTIGGTEQYIRDNLNAQNGFTNAVDQTTQSANMLSGVLGKIGGMIGGFFAMSTAVNFAKESMEAFNVQTNSQNQLVGVLKNSVDDVAGAYDKLTKKASEIQGKGIYGDEAMIGAAGEFATYFKDMDAVTMMMDTLSDYAMGMSGGGALDTTQLVDYATNLGKIMTGAYDAMTKKGFEFTDAQKKIIEGTADQATIIKVLGEEYANASSDVAAAATITQIIDESWADLYTTMSNTPEGKIIQLKNAFGDLQEVVGGRLYGAWMSIIDAVNANWQTIESFVTGFTDGLMIIIGVIGELISYAMQFGQLIADNWGWISPIIYGVVGALMAYNAIMGIVTAVQAIHAAATTVSSIAYAIYTAAVSAAAAGQSVFNAVLDACPITWIVMAVIALVAALIAFCNYIAQSTDLANTWLGVLMGGLAAIGAFIYNVLIGLVNIVLAVVNAMTNHFATFGNFLANVFVDPIGAIIHLFEGMAQTVLSILAGIARAIDSIFGSNLASAVSGWSSSLSSKADALAAKYGNGDYKEVFKGTELTASDLGLKRIDYGEAFNVGADWGDNVANTISDKFNSFTKGGASMNPDIAGAIGDLDHNNNAALNDIGNSANRGANAAEKVSNEVDISNENLKYLRDLAETEVINRVTMPEITVNQTNNNNVSSDLDIDSVVSHLTDGVNEAMMFAAEGVHG